MDNSIARGRSRRSLHQRVTFSPEPTQSIKKAEPKSSSANARPVKKAERKSSKNKPKTAVSNAEPAPTSVKDFLDFLQRTGNIISIKTPDETPTETSSTVSTPPVAPLPSPPLRTIKPELPAHLASYLPERHHRAATKKVSDFAPSLVSKDSRRRSLTVEKLHSPPFSPEKCAPTVSDEIAVEEDHTDQVSENFEIEEEPIFEDPVSYLKSLHLHLRKSFDTFEDKYKDEYFLREILSKDIVSAQDNDVYGEVDIESCELLPKRTYDFLFSVRRYANDFVCLFPEMERIEFNLIPDHIDKFIANEDATGVCLKIFYEILQKQCCMELVVKKHAHPLASYYLYSLQNATFLRYKIFLHFSYELVQAHEWLIRHLPEDILASYLMILKFLQAAGTTLGKIFLSHSSPNDHKNPTANVILGEMLEIKVRDPFGKMLTQLDRKLNSEETFLMLISPGIKLENPTANAVYHAHEQLFVGLTNMGCTIEKIIIQDDDNLSKKTNFSEACDFAVNFIKTKIVDVVKRRPNARIFIASWGVTCLFVHEAVIDIDGVSGVIDLAMPVKSTMGSRGKIGDKILLTYCPTLAVVGEDSGDLAETAEMLHNFHIASGLCVVGSADSSLIVEPSLLADYGITQACINRIILSHIMDFIERVVKDTHNKIHTKKLEVNSPWFVEEDLNDHVMRDENAYCIDEKFNEDEEEPAPSTIKEELNDHFMEEVNDHVIKEEYDYVMKEENDHPIDGLLNEENPPNTS